jgi:hypothetical protein
MRFGDISDFAIEAEVEPDISPPSSVWGRMCIWCRGEPLGNLSEPYCGLGAAAYEFRWLRCHLTDLWDECLEGLDDRDANDFLDGLLYGYRGGVEIEDERTSEEMNRDATRFSKFNFLTNWGEQFDGYKSFILCPPAQPVRILSRHLPDRMNGVAVVTREGLLSAVEDFLRWFDEQEKRLLPPF